MSFRDRLRRLRREEVEAPLSSVAQRLATRRHYAAQEVLVDPRATCGEPQALEAFDGPLGAGVARVTCFDVDHMHGDFELREVRHAALEDFVLLTDDVSLEQLDLERAVYLDTETTGLSGGAGTYVYMVGLGRFHLRDARPSFEVWQGFLPGPEGEARLLAESARRIADSSGVVSFFGKSFDRHRLQDKMQLCGVTPPFDGLPHLDLYHPCKRLYGGAYENGRLKTMEAELCGLQREDDLPGSLAPAAWFDFLAGRPHLLEGVFRHNLDDVLSLVTLAAHLGRTRAEQRADGRALAGDEGTRALGLARSLARTKQRTQALIWLERAVERGAGPTRVLQRERADLLRLAGQRGLALDAYRELVGGPEDSLSVPCLVEVAKLLEHDGGDPGAALECCRTAQVLLERNHIGRDYARLKRELEKRAARLAGKLV